jgi:hypothetical protein
MIRLMGLQFKIIYRKGKEMLLQVLCPGLAL